MKRYVDNPFDTSRFDLKALRSAESLAEIKPKLCAKCYGDVTVCISCPDPHCEIGKKARELLERDTTPEHKQDPQPEPEKETKTVAEKAPSTGKNDPDYYFYVNAVNSARGPVKWLMMTQYQFLSSRPTRFTRKDAVDFLNKFHFMYPDAETEISLEEALQREEQGDYADIVRKIRSGSSENFVASFYAKHIYNIKVEEAAAYIASLRDKYEKPEVKKKPNATDEQYAALLDQEAELQEQLELRKDEIQDELALIRQMIEMYTGIIEKIQEKEQALALYPEESKPEEDDDLIDLPLILEEEGSEEDYE